MKNIFVRGLAIFLILIITTHLMINVMKVEFGTQNFWETRGIFFLFFIAIFPRLTLLFSSVASGGFLWWLGFIFCPRILVAVLATISYFYTNPILVTLSWLIALGGEVLEKWGMGPGRIHIRTFRGSSSPQEPNSRPTSSSSLGSDDIIEAEFTKK